VHYREWLGVQDPVMRLPHVAGEKMYVDFCGDTVAVVDGSSGEVWQAQVFVAVLGASGYLYTEAVRGQDSQSWLDVHVRTFEFYGGVPEVVVPDYVARHIIRLLCPSELCGGAASVTSPPCSE
jgi:transposase